MRIETVTAALVATSLVCGVASAQPLVERRGPAMSPTTPADWLRHPCDDKTYQESWTVIARSTEGHVMYVTFIYTNLGVVSGSAGVNVSLTMPGGQARQLRFDHSTGDFAQDPGSGTISMGPDSLSLSRGKGKLVVAEPGLRLELGFEAWTKGVKFHTGRVYFDADRSEWADTFFHVPRATFSGELTFRGRKVGIRGDLYIDHVVQNVLGTSYSTRWWTVRVFDPGHTVSLLVYRTPKALGGGLVSRALVTDRHRVLLLTDRVELRPSGLRRDPKGHLYTTRIDFSFSGPGVRVSGHAVAKRVHERNAILERLSWVERKVAGLVAGNPIMYRMLAEPHVILSEGRGPGVALSGLALVENLVMDDED